MIQGALFVFVVYFGFLAIVAWKDGSKRQARNNGIVVLVLMALYVLAGGGS